MKKLMFVVWLAIAGLAPFFLLSCEPEVEKPIITIIDIEEVTDTSAIVVGELVSNGGATIIEMGATVYPNRTIIFEGQLVPGRFTVKVDGLVPNTDYQIGVYATNIAGRSLGGWISFRTKPATPVDDKFSLPGTRMTDVITDSEGNVYVAGTFGGVDRRNDCFIAKFDSEGGLAWRDNIVTSGYDFPRGRMVIDENNEAVYFHHNRDDKLGIGGGDLYLNSYNAETGSLNWSKPQEGSAGYAILDHSGNIIANRGNSGTFLISPAGEKIASYPSGQGVEGGACFWGDDLLTVGSILNNSKTVIRVSKFSGFFQEKIWSFDGSDFPDIIGASGIVCFPEDSLVVVSWLAGRFDTGEEMKTFITAYQISFSNPIKVWEKEYKTWGLGLIREDDAIYAFAPVHRSFSPRKINLQGEEIWKAAASNGVISVHQDKTFLVDGGGMVKILK